MVYFSRDHAEQACGGLWGPVEWGSWGLGGGNKPTVALTRVKQPVSKLSTVQH